MWRKFCLHVYHGPIDLVARSPVVPIENSASMASSVVVDFVATLHCNSLWEVVAAEKQERNSKI